MRKLAGTELGAVLRHLPEWPCILVHEEEGGGGGGGGGVLSFKEHAAITTHHICGGAIAAWQHTSS